MLTVPGLQLHLPFPSGSPTFNGTSYDTTKNHFLMTEKATVDETVSRYGGGSCRFGTDTWLTAKNSPRLNFGTGDFTIGFWMYIDIAWNLQGSAGIVGQKTGDSSNGFQIYRNPFISPTKLALRVAGIVDVFTNGEPTLQTWEHWEFNRSGTTLYIFKNGVLDKTVASFNYNISDTLGRLQIGRSQTWNANFFGRLDDIFISNQALHTSNFTPDEIYWDGIVAPTPGRGVSMARVVRFIDFNRIIGSPRSKPNPGPMRYEAFNYGGPDSRYQLLQANTNGNLRGVVLQNTVPVAGCRVGLYDRYTMVLVDGAKTKSDGTFRFNNQLVGYDGYFLIAFDPDGAPMQNAVILDKLTAT